LQVTDDIHILIISETHLDNTFDDTVGTIHGYNIYRKDRNAKGGGVADYIQNHIPLKFSEDLIFYAAEVKWLQVHLPHLKVILVESCYRLQSVNSQYLDNSVKCLKMYVISTERYIQEKSSNCI
jgi:hypothetical protein